MFFKKSKSRYRKKVLEVKKSSKKSPHNTCQENICRKYPAVGNFFLSRDEYVCVCERACVFVRFYRVVSMCMYFVSLLVSKVHISRGQWLPPIGLFILISFSDTVFSCITFWCYVILLSNAIYS